MTDEEDTSLPTILTYVFGLYRARLNTAESNVLEALRTMGYDSLPAQLLPYIQRRLNYQLTPKERELRSLFRWLLESREITNFTCNLSNSSRKFLASFLEVVTGIDAAQMIAYMNELETDDELRGHIYRETGAGGNRFDADAAARYGRRAGWYATVRALKPKVVIETGIDKGFGSVVLAAALRRNDLEGHPGRYFGTEINPESGFLFKPPYSEYGEILFGDSVKTLQNFDQPIDLFIADSCHDPEYEYSEYKTVEKHLHKQSILYSDTGSDSPIKFAAETNRHALQWVGVALPEDYVSPGQITAIYPKTCP